MKKLKFPIFILTIILFITCNIPPKKISVSGQAIDAVTCAPIPNAHLVLGNYHATGTGYSVDVLDETYTDANGNYQFEFKNASGSEFHIAGKANNYFDTDIYDNIIPEEKHVNNFNIHFTPIGFIKLTFNKSDSSYTNLEIGFTGNYNINYHLNIGGSNPNSSSVVLESKGGQYNSIDYRVYKYLNSSLIFTEIENRSFYCLAGDTSNYLLNY
ncbi:MAG TPA: hypothetical protein PLN13_01350 [Bacteroidia bacterium]|nr:hypothetical protein [Bacteroidia bacterium]